MDNLNRQLILKFLCGFTFLLGVLLYPVFRIDAQPKKVDLVEGGAEMEDVAYEYLGRGRADVNRFEYIKQQVFKDWLLQDYGVNNAACFTSQVNADLEIKLVEKILLSLDKGMVGEITDRFNALKVGGVVGGDVRWRELYVDICEVRRGERLKPLLEKVKRFVFVKGHPRAGSFYGYTEGQSDAQSESNFRPNSEMCVFEMDGIYGKEYSLLKDKTGVIRDPDISYDGKRLLFAWKASHRQDDYHLYEMNLLDGAIRQLTFGKTFSDYEGIYLPDGDIVFSSTRGVSTIECWWTESSNLWRCDKDGKLIHRLGFDQVTTNYPTLLEDGRIVYTRWDYNDRGQTFPQPLFVMNPDGTNQTEYYGNNSWFPTVIDHAREIPGSKGKMLAILHGHHTHQRGKLAVIDRNKGTQEAEGVQLVAPVRETKAVIVDAYGQDGEQFQYPYPITDNTFLVTYDPIGGGNRKYPRPYGIYFMDMEGNRELLVSDPDIHCKQAYPLKARMKPHVRSSYVDYRKQTGSVFMQDIYQGPGLKGIARGTVKKLRVVEMKLRSAGVGMATSSGPHSQAINSTPAAVGNGSWDVKKILGDVTVHKDGSAYFEIPARKPVYFQALDSKNHVVQTMRTWMTAMPNERVSCIGCHEPKDNAPPMRSNIALAMGLEKMSDFYGPARGFSFPKEIQPILDDKCISCHQGKDAFSLLGKIKEYKKEKRNWSESYLNLTQAKPNWGGALHGKIDNKYVQWIGAQSEPTLLKPYLRGAHNSKLIKILEEDHKGVKMTREEMDKFAAWIDLFVPYSGDYTESGAWNKADKHKYAHYQAKRHYMREYDRINREVLVKNATGEAVALPMDLEDEYLAFINKHAPDSQKRFDEMLKLHHAKVNNLYRNVALNPHDKASGAYSYPHASSNSEYKLPKGDQKFFAKNVIDGKTENTDHDKYASWGPYRVDDAWLKIDFGNAVVVDQMKIFIRADFPHDTHWDSGVLEFSDGSEHAINLKKTKDAQVFRFDKRRVEWVKIKNLKQTGELGWASFSEIEVWGKSSTEQE